MILEEMGLKQVLLGRYLQMRALWKRRRLGTVLRWGKVDERVFKLSCMQTHFHFYG